MDRTRAIAVAALLPCAPASGQDLLSEIDQANAGFTYASGMGFESGPGELHSSRFHARSFLSEPSTLGRDWLFAPMVQYRGTLLDVDGAAPGFPLQDETLHYLALQGFLIHTQEHSPWIYGVWARGGIASDFQQVDGDDFLFDVAGGVGYRVNSNLLVAFGGGVFELNGDEKFLFGPSFSWRAAENFKLSLYGHTFDATWNRGRDWVFSLRSEAGGGTWNLDGAGGVSQRLDFRSYLIGLHAGRRLKDSLWLDLGAGVSLANKLELGSPDGLTAFKDHPDEGWFVYAGVRLADW